jgi:hypothetical protein
MTCSTLDRLARQAHVRALSRKRSTRWLQRRGCIAPRWTLTPTTSGLVRGQRVVHVRPVVDGPTNRSPLGKLADWTGRSDRDLLWARTPPVGATNIAIAHLPLVACATSVVCWIISVSEGDLHYFSRNLTYRAVRNSVRVLLETERSEMCIDRALERSWATTDNERFGDQCGKHCLKQLLVPWWFIFVYT